MIFQICTREYHTLRVCSRSLIAFNGSDSAANTTGVWRSSDIESMKTSCNFSMIFKVSGGTEPFLIDWSCWLRKFTHSFNVCNQMNFSKVQLNMRDIYKRSQQNQHPGGICIYNDNCMVNVYTSTCQGARKKLFLSLFDPRIWYLVYIKNAVWCTFKLYMRVIDWRSIMGSHQKISQCQWMIKLYNLLT